MTTADAPGDLLPRPDPSLLTTQQLRRELDIAKTEIRREIEDGRALLGIRIENEVRRNDERHATLVVTLDRRFGDVLALITAEQDTMRADTGHLRELHEGRFTAVAQQFAERDVRTEQAATASTAALAAALLSARELVAQQNEANRAAAAKTEQNFGKQIEAASARIDELKERIDRGGGEQAGAAGQRNETRLNLGAMVAAGVLLISVLTFIILYVLKK